MKIPEPSASAWEPLTPRGVAAFALAAPGRLWLTQTVVALAVAAAVVWALATAWCPVVGAAIEQLPTGGEIRAGKLDWRGPPAQMLAEGQFLALSVDLEYTGKLRSPAHVQVQFGKEAVFCHSLLGHVEWPYPGQWIIAFNREELSPWWGAWQPALLASAGGAVVVALLALWYVLATLYAPPVWLAAFFANRDLRLNECSRLAGAALMPGALFMAAGIVLYGVGVLDLVGLGFVAIGHVVLGWIYLLASPLFLSTSATATRQKNPFRKPDR